MNHEWVDRLQTVEPSGRDQPAVEWTEPSWLDFELVILAAVALAVLVYWGSDSLYLAPWRLVLGIGYILFAPGYCLAAALLPAAEDLDRIERLGLSIGLSIALVPLVGLFLDQTPWGLRVWPIVTSEYAVTLLLIALAAIRRLRLRPEDRYNPEWSCQPYNWWRSQAPLQRRIYRLLAGAILVAIAGVAWTLLVPTPDQYWTTFYMLGSGGRAENYPREGTQEQILTTTLGLVNGEQTAHLYRVEVWVTSSEDSTQQQLVGITPSFSLSTGQSREWSISWRMPWRGADQKVEFLLFAGQNPVPYRTLRLWINVE